MQTLTVEVLNDKAYRLLEDLAALELIRLHTQSAKPDTANAVPEKPERQAGFANAVILQIADDFNEPLEEFKEYMP